MSNGYYTYDEWAKVWQDLLKNPSYTLSTDHITYILGEANKETAMADWCTYQGKRVRLLSLDYQTGQAVLEDRDVTGPYTFSVPIADIQIENPKASNKCTCGVDSVGTDKHSDWCDKYFGWE